MCCFSLTKPGWVHIFRTYRRVFQCLQRLRDEYIIFDDELERIENILSQTEDLVKGVYKDFYRKTLRDWLDESDFFYCTPGAPQSLERVLVLHLAVGQSLIAAFFDDFRLLSNLYRTKYLEIFTQPPDIQFPQQMALHQIQPTLEQYLNDKNLCQWAQPFRANIWKTTFNHIFADFDQMTANQLRIDLNAANTV